MMRLTSSPAMRPASLVAWRWASLKYAGTVITARSTGSPRKSPARGRGARSPWADPPARAPAPGRPPHPEGDGGEFAHDVVVPPPHEPLDRVDCLGGSPRELP